MNLNEQCHEWARYGLVYARRAKRARNPFNCCAWESMCRRNADRIIAARAAELADRVEVGRLAGQLGWYVFVGGLLDCDIPAHATEIEAICAAQDEYPDRTVFDSDRHARFNASAQDAQAGAP